MKVLELLTALNETFDMYGDIDVEVCQYSEDDRKYYWMSCAFEKDGRFFVGFDVKSLNKFPRER